MRARLAMAGQVLASKALTTWAALVNACRGIIADPAGAYRPEAHYMRGPGPKWRERHADREAKAQ